MTLREQMEQEEYAVLSRNLPRLRRGGVLPRPRSAHGKICTTDGKYEKCP